MYGGLSLQELESQIYKWGSELGRQVRCRQTNSEGAVRRVVPRRAEVTDGVIVNPAAWTHYSWAIRDALELSGKPVVEVHLSNVDEREEWRRFSVLDGRARATASSARGRRATARRSHTWWSAA